MINSPTPALGPAQYTPAQLINRLISEAFAPPLSRVVRSPEYLNGVRALLLQKLIGKPLASPFPAGTAAADAFFAGVNEGRSIYARNISAPGAASPVQQPELLPEPSTANTPTYRLEVRRTASYQWAGRVLDAMGEEVAGIGGCTSADEVEQGAHDAGFCSLEVIRA